MVLDHFVGVELKGLQIQEFWNFGNFPGKEHLLAATSEMLISFLKEEFFVWDEPWSDYK